MRTSFRAAKNSSRGFTLIELGAVVVVMALFATAVAVRVNAAQRGAEIRQFQMELVGLVEQGRARAVGSRRDVALTLDVDANRVRLEWADEDLTAAPTPGRPTPSTGALASVAVPAEARLNRAEAPDGSEDTRSFRARFFQDGTAERARIEFRFGDDARVFELVEETGLGRWVSGELTERVDERWEAGDWERRG